MNTAAFRKDLEHLGPARALARAGYYAARRGASLLALDCMRMTADDVDEGLLGAELPFACRFLERDEVLARPSAELGLGDLRRDDALRKGDRCLAILDGAAVASCGWYSHRPTRVVGDLVMRFDERYAYMYGGYTRDEYRGMRLHGIGLARALHAHVELGAPGLLTVVEWANFASRRSARRAGFRHLGWALGVGGGRRARTLTTGACAPYGMRLERVPEERA
jgi:hypothetical protein